MVGQLRVKGRRQERPAKNKGDISDMVDGDEAKKTRGLPTKDKGDIDRDDNGPVGGLSLNFHSGSTIC